MIAQVDHRLVTQIKSHSQTLAVVPRWVPRFSRRPLPKLSPRTRVGSPVLECIQGSGFKVQGSGFRVQGSGFRVQGLGFKVQGSGFRVQGSGFRVQGL